MLLSTLPLRRYAPRRQYFVGGLEYLRPDVFIATILFRVATHRDAHSTAKPDLPRTFQSTRPQPSAKTQDNSLLKSKPARLPVSKYFAECSPNVVLQDWLKHGYGGSKIRDRLARSAAASASSRLAIIVLQVDMKNAEAKKPSNLSDHLISDDELAGKLTYLAGKGITRDDIEAWLWILKADHPHEMAHRLASSDQLLPPFVIRRAFDSKLVYTDPASLVQLLSYLARAIRVEVPSSACGSSVDQGIIESPETRSVEVDKASAEFRFRITPQLFTELLELLVHHSRHVWPASLPSIARIAARYIESMVPPGSSTIDRDLLLRRRQNSVHNAALVAFSRPAAHRPLNNLRHNWEAQKIILALSTKLPWPLLLDQGSFRAIRAVLGGLRKSQSERLVASRLSKTWPPYRQEWDGIDEKRHPEDDYSRSVKAGILAREAGYSAEAYDQALDIIGGAAIGKSPFIHSRTIAPKANVGKAQYLNDYAPWAASIRATRNAHEAWQAFLRPPRPGMPPSANVYAEMFAKLYARESEDTLPGTGLEASPVYDVNLSDFEKARLQPPRPSELYAKMRAAGTRPVSDCLLVLLRNARSLKQLARYLEDSPEQTLASRTFVDLVDRHHTSGTAFDLSEAKILCCMPLKLFRACAIGVCNTLPHHHPADGPIRRPRTSHRIVNLMNMILARMEDAPAAYMALWHVVLEALSRPNIAVATPRPSAQPYETMNRIHALRMFLGVFHHVRKTTGVVDIFMFNRLCLILRRVLSSVGFRRGVDEDADLLIDDAHEAVKASAEKLTQPVATPQDSRDDWLDFPQAGHQFGPLQVRSYFRTLAYLGDLDELLKRMDWIIGPGIGAEGQAPLLDNASDSDQEHLYLSVVMFRASMEHLLPQRPMAGLKAKLAKVCEERGLAWSWPTDEDVDMFMEAERHRGDEAVFWERDDDRYEGAGCGVDQWEGEDGS